MANRDVPAFPREERHHREARRHTEVGIRDTIAVHSVRRIRKRNDAERSAPVPDSFSDQARLPAELKHITKRRKRN